MSDDVVSSFKKLSLSEYKVVSTVDEVENASKCLEKEAIVSIDSEGVDLGRVGQCTLLQMKGKDDPCCFVFDLVVLKKEDLKPIKQILEDTNITKLIFDGRQDCDALLWQFDIRVQNMIDLQLLETSVRRRK